MNLHDSENVGPNSSGHTLKVSACETKKNLTLCMVGEGNVKCIYVYIHII